MSILLELTIMTVSFFDFWVCVRIKEGKRLLSLATQFVFIFLFTLPMGVFISILLYIISGVTNSTKIFHLQVLLLVTLILSSVLFMMVVLNLKDKKYNLPNVILDKLLILTNLKLQKEWFGIGETLLFLFASSIGLSFLIAYVFELVFPFYMDIIGAVYIVFFSLLISVFVFSEATEDAAERAVRQLILWLILFIVLVIAGCYQLKDLMYDISNPQNQVNMVLLVFGLIFNVSTIADKIRLFFDESKKHLYVNLEVTRTELHRLYSYREDFSSVKQLISKVIKLWREGSLKDKCKLLLIAVVLLLMVMILWNINTLLRNFIRV